MAERVEAMGRAIDPRDPESLRFAHSTLTAIIDDLQKMLVLGDDVQDESKKGLMDEVKTLLTQTTTLRQHLERAIAIQPKIKPTTPTAPAAAAAPSVAQRAAAPAPAPSDPPSATMEQMMMLDRVPLEQEEIAKLLLLTSRAWKANRLTDRQRNFIKGVIVRREGYLRVVLSFGSIEATFGALAAVGGSDDDDDDSEDEEDEDDDEEDDDEEYDDDYEDEYEVI